MRFLKCDLCNAKISGKKCIFAVHKRVIDDEKYYFCCEHHANEFERNVSER